MREIEFRGKRVDNGEWVIGFLSEAHTIKVLNSWYEPEAGCRHDEYNVIPGTVGQYIGIKDDEQIKLYEHDIVKMAVDDTVVIGEIVYVGTGFFISDNHDLWEIDHYYSLVKLGNRFDNPELLKGE
jgi:hypothetical protein